MHNMVAGVGFAVDDQCSVRICFGLFAIRRTGTTNYAMFDPDFCGVWSFLCYCAFHSAFFTDYDFSSPQNRFKGPKLVMFKSHNHRQPKKELIQSPKMVTEFLWQEGPKKISCVGLHF